MDSTLAFSVGGFCAGGVAGWLLVPWGADVLLRRAYARAHSWWWDSYRSYSQLKDAMPNRSLSVGAPGEEGAVALWLEDALRAARSGHLSCERSQALEAAGLGPFARADVRTEVQQSKRCSFRARGWQRAVCALALSLVGAWLASVGLPVVPSLALGMCALLLSMAVVCDLRARMIPLECCAGIAAAGMVLQALTAGIAGLAMGAVLAVVVVAVCLAANRWGARGGAAPVGQGDVRCMAALSLATGAAAPIGLAVCYGGAALFSLAGLALKRLTLRDGIPLAPFLVLWLASGALGVVGI